MYKPTFFNFLGNKKYPEIYILPSNLPTIPTVPTVPDIPTIPTITPNLPTLWLHKVRNDSTVVAVCWRERRADGGENQISNHPTRRKVTPCENILYTFDRHWQDWMWAFFVEFWVLVGRNRLKGIWQPSKQKQKIKGCFKMILVEELTDWQK